MPELPTRGLARGARLASVPAAFVGRRAASLGKRVAGRPAELVAAEVHARTAEQLFSVLGELKGGAMKVGQWLSAMEAALPPQLAGPYADALTRLQDSAPAMPFETVQEVLASSFGVDWRDKFRSFDERPTAAASIGQVHRAVWLDGQTVAVKVQYPGAGEALTTDLRQLDRLTPLLRVAAPGLDAHGLFTELRARVMAEVDYAQEAAAQAAFARVFDGDPDVVVPAPVAVSGAVLVTEWVRGTPVASIARSGTERQRRRAGLLLARFLLSSPSRVGRLHGDPHPGNFRLLADGRLAVVDFGSSLLMPDGWPARLGTFLRSARDRDADALLGIATDAGLVGPDDVTPAALLDLVDPLVEPLRQRWFPFSRSWLRTQTLRFSDPRSAVAHTQRKLRMPVRHLLVQRVTAGTVGVLCLLGVPVPVRTEAERWMPALADETPRGGR